MSAYMARSRKVMNQVILARVTVASMTRMRDMLKILRPKSFLSPFFVPMMILGIEMSHDAMMTTPRAKAAEVRLGQTA